MPLRIASTVDRPITARGSESSTIGTKTGAETRAPFFFANADDEGYFRAVYAKDEYAAIVANAETGLSAAERIGLLGDRWALMEAGHGSVGDYLDLALALKNDPNANVLETAPP